jgi:ABC-type nickel/cobalt efflux system permease component RcnA
MHSKRPGLFLTLLFSLWFSGGALAHPMGNFSVNHYSRISLQNDRIRIQYFIDLAEIPAYQELQRGSITASTNDPAVTHFITNRGAELGQGLSLTLDGKPLPLRLKSSGVIFPPGAGGLPTMKMGFVYEAAYPATADRAHASLHYADKNYAGHTGWKEIITVAAAGSLLKSSVPATDRSAGLNNYPTDLLSSPPQDLEASFKAALPPVKLAVSTAQPHVNSETLSRQANTPATVAVRHQNHLSETPEIKPARKASASSPVAPSAKPVETETATASSPSVQLVANQQQTPRSRFTELITAQHLSPWFLFTAALIAMGLGALHALEPGHGKTIVAAYLVGSRGTARHAVLLGLIVTVSHTAGVFALGAVTLYASRYIVPEQLYPWLGVLSGITIAGLGCYMFLRRVSGTATDHSHVSGSAHSHWVFSKRTVEEGATSDEPRRESASIQSVSFTQLFTLGITGGIIPCPAALIVLLSAFALHRIGLGFFLIVAFSLGLAAVLISFGMVMVYARRFLTHLQIDGPLTTLWLPLASSAFITVLGLVVAIQAFFAMHLNFPILSKERLGPVLFVTGLGLILGMRHSTDADHVVAISTIVSKQRSIRNAAFIGSVWGLGHTITIFIVGSLIILFGVEIPPRIGLSMEFSVAIMLILLGVLNLTGVMQKITAYYTPANVAPATTSGAATRSGIWKPTESFFENSVGRFGVYQCLRPLVIGLVHGLAGSAAVALLVLSTIHNPIWATIYLLIFGVGTMIGMMCMTAAIAVPLTYAGDRFTKLSHYLGVASGMVSLCFGSFLVYQLGFLGGLFTSHPQWTPR